MVNNNMTPQQAMAVSGDEPLKEMFRWVYWRHRKCT